MAWPCSTEWRSPPPEQQEFRGYRSRSGSFARTDLSPASPLQSRERRLSCEQRNFPPPRSFDKSADLPLRHRPDRFPSSPSSRRLPTRAGHIGRVHLRLRWPVLLRRSRFGDAAERDRASTAVLHLVGIVDRRKSENATDRGAGSVVDGLFRQISRSLHYRPHDVSQSDGSGPRPHQRRGNAACSLESSAA